MYARNTRGVTMEMYSTAHKVALMLALSGVGSNFLEAATKIEGYLIPGIKESRLDTNNRSSLLQYVLPRSSCAQRPTPTYRFFGTKLGALSAMNQNIGFKEAYAEASDFDEQTINNYGSVIDADYKKAHERFNASSAYHRSQYTRCAALGFCSMLLGGIVTYAASTPVTRGAGATFGLHGLYSFCRNMVNCWKVSPQNNPDLSNDLDGSCRPTEGDVSRQRIRYYIAVGKYGSREVDHSTFTGQQ